MKNKPAGATGFQDMKTRKQRLKAMRRHESQYRRARIIETQILDAPLKDSCVGGFLEVKEGMVCLRFGDSIHALTANKYLITRSWLKPSKQPFDTDLYPIKT